MTATRIMIVAGEPSGDLHGASLIRSLRAMAPDCVVRGMGGTEMAAAGMEVLVDSTSMAVMGVAEILGHLRHIRAAMRTLEHHLARRPPDLLILIDYPGFNLMLAAKAKARQIPVLYYISPKVWAWRSGRVHKIRKRVDKMAVILPFEQSFYHRFGMQVDYVGNPLLDTVRAKQSRNDFLAVHHLAPDTTVIGILPGSRCQEITAMLPILLEAARKIVVTNQARRCVFFLPMAPSLTLAFLRENGLDGIDLDIRIISKGRYDMMAACDVVMAASGTVTLELAVLHVPMVVAYRVAWLTWFLGRKLVHLEHASLVNLVAGREIVPEFLQHDATPEALSRAVNALLNDPATGARMQRGLEEVRTLLGGPGASKRTARLALEMIGRIAPEPRAAPGTAVG